MRVSATLFVLLTVGPSVLPAQAGDTAAKLTPARADAVFREARHLCRADDGHLWGMDLCAPMMLVDPSTGELVASQADAGGKLTRTGDVYVGHLPAGFAPANTSVEWSGTHWVQYMWPLSSRADLRRVLLAHEMFHHVQDRLGLPATGADNAQLDTLWGRYDLQLEWRALAAALKATDDTARRQAIRDALAFRADRHHRFPKAAAGEAALERNEGLAEYTGVMLGGRSPAERVTLALNDLRTQTHDTSFVRSFAYATGPAYGLLLDRYLPGWRTRIRHAAHTSPAGLLADALRIPMAAPSAADLHVRAARYDGATLWAAESKRARAHERVLAGYRKRLVHRPVLVLPLSKPHIEFNPHGVTPLPGAGTVYTPLKASDAWGHIETTRGGLIDSHWHRLTVDAPTQRTAHAAKGPGWTLHLAPGWRLVPGVRPRDVTVSRTKQ